MTKTEKKKKIPLVIVDIQPSYEESMPSGYVDKVIVAIEQAVKDKRPVMVFYNSEEFSGSSSEESQSYFEFNGLSSKSSQKLLFVEKEYAFYRNWMDEGFDDKVILAAIQMMRNDNINDSRDFKEHHWEKLSEINGEEFLTSKLDRESYILTQPYFDCDFDPVDLFKNKEIEMIGGGRYECLEELKLHFEASGVIPIINEELSYGAHTYTPEHKKTNSSSAIKPKL